MTQPIIEVNNLGIKFRLFHLKKESLNKKVIALGKLIIKNIINPGSSVKGYEDFWALRDVSFSLNRGDVLGIIGENGSGKSTLLKTLSGIFRPDEGKVNIGGRVGALLELGAGFHSELTGRENIYLNGSILGLKRYQVNRIFDDIVGFSELEKFIDTPLKNYSSGMKVRLGFSIAVQLDPEILLIDEVLAVGDLAFRIKCIEKMNEFKQKGVSIIIVSHSMGTLQNFCSRGILLSKGKVEYDGDMVDCIDKYIYTKKGVAHDSRESRWGNESGTIKNISVADPNGREYDIIKTGDPVVVKVSYAITKEIKDPVLGISLVDEKNNKVYGINTSQAEGEFSWAEKGDVVFRFPSFDLSEGTYFVTVALHDENPTIIYDWLDKNKTINVLNLKKFGGKFDLGCEIEGFTR